MAEVLEWGGERFITAPEGSVVEVTTAIQLAWLAVTRRSREVGMARDSSKAAVDAGRALTRSIIDRPDVLKVDGDIFLPDGLEGERLSAEYARAVQERCDAEQWATAAYAEYREWSRKVADIVDGLLGGSFLTVVANRGYAGFPRLGERRSARGGVRELRRARYCSFNAVKRALLVQESGETPDQDGPVYEVRLFAQSAYENAPAPVQVARIELIEFIENTDFSIDE